MNEPIFHFYGNKAGVEGADQIKQVIDDATRGSEYYKRQQEKRLQVLQKVNKMQIELENYNKNEQRKKDIKEIIQNKVKEFQINTDRIWAHFDMDMFYVACELLDKPELIDKPVAVGQSIVSTANYVARKYGVRSAMPTFVAKKLCPDIIFIPCHFEKYKSVSNIFMTILKKYDDNLESMGLDEANLDLTQYINNSQEDPAILCENIRKDIFLATQLTASCGVGPNKMIAKLASEINKPNGLHVVQQSPIAVLSFLEKLPVRKIPGIGNITEQILSGLNFNTCKDVRDRADELYIIFTPKTFEYIFYSCWGVSRNYHVEFEDQHSISCQRTFSSISTQKEFEDKVDYIAEKLAEEMQSEEKVGNHLTLIIKTSKFEIRNKSLQLNQYTNQSKQIALYGKQLLKIMQLDEPIRLLGLKMSSLANEKQIQKQSISTYFKKQFDKSNDQENQITSNMSSKSHNICQDSNPILKVQLQQPEQSKPEIISDDEVSSISNQIISGVNSKSNQSQAQQQKFQQKQQAQPKSFNCPICNKDIDCKGNNTVLNKHIDRCINQQNVIAELSDESNKNVKDSKKKVSSKIENKVQKSLNFFKKGS
ncbi:unnamed protein product [Paramecium pentaurelia]|uniref:DNA polymerase kappa n=1 Tax=Paramecium pentaurelia TaxID=43138 RepID=A0A8S1TH94_9CILI|nr:unnamed protein product [Paramecium pentaurelia]